MFCYHSTIEAVTKITRMSRLESQTLSRKDSLSYLTIDIGSALSLDVL